jgi:hypothetical protein
MQELNARGHEALCCIRLTEMGIVCRSESVMYGSWKNGVREYFSLMIKS